MERPEWFDFAMDVVGDPEASEIRKYVNYLEGGVANTSKLYELVLGKDRLVFIHNNKSVEEWRSDIEKCKNAIKHEDVSGMADDEVFNSVMIKLKELGYLHISDVIADTYECRIGVFSAGIVNE